MRWLLILIILMFGCKQQDDRIIDLQAVVKDSECSSSLFETKCESNVMFIEEPLIDKHCSVRGLAGSIGDTISIRLRVVDSATVRCMLPWR